jgi:hypothetical protein
MNVGNMKSLKVTIKNHTSFLYPSLVILNSVTAKLILANVIDRKEDVKLTPICIDKLIMFCGEFKTIVRRCRPRPSDIALCATDTCSAKQTW